MFHSKLLETINYIEHYGLVRLEGSPVRPRHSWNSNTFISSAFTFNSELAKIVLNENGINSNFISLALKTIKSILP